MRALVTLLRLALIPFTGRARARYGDARDSNAAVGSNGHLRAFPVSYRLVRADETGFYLAAEGRPPVLLPYGMILGVCRGMQDPKLLRQLFPSSPPEEIRETFRLAEKWVQAQAHTWT